MDRKIIHITLGKANPNRLNGVNKVVNSLITHQINLGVKAYLWGITFDLRHNYPERNYETKLFQDSKSKFKLDPKITEALKKLDPKKSIIHFHGSFIPQLYMISKQLRKLKIKYFHTPHGGYNVTALNKSYFKKIIYMNLFEKPLINNAKGIQLLGNSEIAGTKKHFSPKEIHLITNGQDLHELSKKPKENSDKELSLAFLGRIDIKTKGLDILLEAISLCVKKIDIKLNIIGSGGEINELKALIQNLKLNDYINFKGALFDHEKFTSLKSVDALCLVSRNEGMPGVVLEAASVGTPSIISEGTNMFHYINKFDSGWKLENYNSSSLCELLIKVYSEKQQNNLSQKQANAAKMVSDEFSWKEIASQLCTIYETE